MKLHRVLVLCGLGQLVFAGAAQAAPRYQIEDDEEPVVEEVQVGDALQIGGGISEFKQGPLYDLTGTAGAWDIRLIFGTRSPLAMETAYIGAAYPLRSGNQLTQGYLVSNGMEINLRLNIPLVDEDVMVEPYVIGGIGWMWFTTAQTDIEISQILTGDSTFFMPLGTGLALSFDGLLLDTRFTYRFANSSDMELNTLGRSGVVSSWAFTGHIGFEF